MTSLKNNFHDTNFTQVGLGYKNVSRQHSANYLFFFDRESGCILGYMLLTFCLRNEGRWEISQNSFQLQ